MYLIKRDAEGKLSELYLTGSIPDPENINDYEIIDGEDPEAQRYFDATFSYRAWLKKKASTDPIIKVLALRIAELAGNTPAEELAALEAICESILPDV